MREREIYYWTRRHGVGTLSRGSWACNRWRNLKVRLIAPESQPNVAVIVSVLEEQVHLLVMLGMEALDSGTNNVLHKYAAPK